MTYQVLSIIVRTSPARARYAPHGQQGRQLHISEHDPPLLVALFICFAIRNVILALFMGVVIGGPVSDREKVAHEELAYIVDSTASPVATIIPFNVYGWFAILFTLLFALGKFPLMDHVLTPLLMALLAADLAFVLYTSIAFMIV